MLLVIVYCSMKRAVEELPSIVPAQEVASSKPERLKLVSFLFDLDLPQLMHTEMIFILISTNCHLVECDTFDLSTHKILSYQTDTSPWTQTESCFGFSILVMH